MDDDRTGRVARAILFFSALGGGVGAAIIVIIGVLAVLLGDPIGIGEIVLPLVGASGLGALVGGAFAGGVATLGRTEASDRLPHWKAGVAGAMASFVVPLVAAALFLYLRGDLQVSVFELIVRWTEAAWWLLGIGGVVGVGLNGVARRPELKAGDEDVPQLPAESGLGR
ncbi:hypothetical protein V3331_13295 [Gaopeijia maritima]|uniref:hypothetical protein n=1 Tax=Gaopeijia maritima TaxID=3119007 RepID=UPI0032522611